MIRILEAPQRAAAGTIRLLQNNLKLRTKLLLSFALLIAGITLVTLLAVRHNAEVQAQLELERDAQNAILVFQGMQRHQMASLGRKADLLAWTALMRDGDATAVDEASADPWRAEDCNLFVLANKAGRILALRSSVDGAGSSGPLAGDAQTLLTDYLKHGQRSGWWFSGDNLYEVVLQPYFSDAPTKKELSGYVIVGRSMDERAASDLARITSSDIVFRYASQVAVSTFSPLEQQEFAETVKTSATPKNSGNPRLDPTQVGLHTSQVKIGGRRYFATSLPLTHGVETSAELTVLKSYSQVEAYLTRLNRLLIGLGLAAIAIGGTLIFFIADAMIRPIASLVNGVEALELGDFSYPLEATGRDETSTLTRSFQSMRSTLRSNQALREELETQLRQAQKMDALGRLAGGVAHDFNNLLTVIRGHSELMLDRLEPGDALHGNTQQIHKTADRAAALTRQLLAFSRMQMVQPKVLDLNELISDMGKLLRRLIREDIEFGLRLGESLGRVKADSAQVEQLLLNLTVNASDAMPHGGRLTIETHNLTVDFEMARSRAPLVPGKYVTLRVSDTGHGMNADTMAQIFEPFFTTKEPGKGTGLGLATVYGVVKQNGGFILVESEPGVGTQFEIYLPRTEEREETSFEDAMRKYKTAGKAQKVVLVVEDEHEVRDITCEFLTAAGYSVLTAANGKDALDVAERMGSSIHVVLADVVMPQMRGPEMGMRLKTILPHVRIVYMTGYLESQQDGASFLEGAFFLQKPFSRDAVVNIVAEALRSKPRSSESLDAALLEVSR